MSYFYPLLLKLAIILNQSGLYNESLSLLNMCPKIQNVSYEKYHFYRACSASVVNDTKTVTESCNNLIDNYNSSKPQYKVIAKLMLLEIARNKDDLFDIGKDMDNAANRLVVAKGGKQTQDIQEGIVKKLNKKIDSLENQLASNMKSDSDGDSNGKSKGQQSKSPASESQILENGGKGLIDEKKLKKLNENWGKMPPIEREKAIQDISRELPQKYKQLVEDYYRQLNRSK